MKTSKMFQYIITICLILILATHVRGLANCPAGCLCDDNTLIVQCGQGQLDVLPIALNPSIQRLVIKNNKIKTIDSSIQFYAELTFLDLSSNHLMTIPQRTFAYQKKLQEMHLNDNKIGQISNKTFIGLSAVTVLNLRGNLISELHQGTFSPLLKMEELNLGENRIGFIDPRAFEGLTQLRILYLDDNALTAVPDPVLFQAMPNLAELFIGMNSLLTVPSAAFADIKGLTRLDLRGAGLRNITHDSFKGLDDVRVLDLSDNRLTRIPTLALSHMARLEELFLGQNDFEVLMEGAFVGLKQLKRLDISGALHLKRVVNGAFSSNSNLEYLNLSSNKMLSEIQEGAFSGLPHLRHVTLKANSLTTLAEGLFPWRDLLTLDLSENPMSCDCRVMWLQNLLLLKNNTNDAVSEIMCEFPERLRGEALKNLNPALMGCTHADPHKQALIGAFLVGTVATLTALTLVIYRCRRKIRDYLKGGIWGNSALGRKEREYQKTFCDEDYMSRHQHHQHCNLGIHSTFPNTYTPSHPSTHHYGMCAMTINDFNNDQKSFQQLRVPPNSTMRCDEKKKVLKSEVLSSSGAAQTLNHYTKPHFRISAAAVGDSCYSYADVPIAHCAAKGEPRRNQVRLTQDHFVHQLHYDNSQDYNIEINHEVLDPNYMYSNAHYSMPLEEAAAAAAAAGRRRTPSPPPLPPALPLRNGLQNTIGRAGSSNNTMRSHH